MAIKTVITFLFTLTLAFAAFAENAEPSTAEKVEEKAKSAEEKVKDVVQSGVDQVEKALMHSRQFRQNSEYFVTLNYAPIDLILPSKWGVTAGLVSNADKTWEIEYLKSSVSVPFFVEDLGEMTDERISLIRRDYFGTETFNVSYGLSYYRFKLHIGNQYLSSVTSTAPDVDLIRIESLGFNLGLGNRWIFSNRWIVGVDWFAWSQPVFTTRMNNKYEDFVTNENDKDTANKAVKLINWIPRLTLLKLQVGYSF